MNAKKILWALPAVLLWGAVAGQGRADIIYSTADYIVPADSMYELVPNSDDGTPDRPVGSLLGNTVTFAGTDRLLTSVDVQFATVHNDGSTTGDQTITLSLYKPDGAIDPTGPGANGNQPLSLIAQSTVVTSALNSGMNNSLLAFTFNTVVPNSVVAIISSSLVGSGFNLQVGPIASIDATPLVGSNPHGDQLWFGTGIGAFQSNNTWVASDFGDAGPSNNLAMVFNATAFNVATTPEPSSLILAGVAGMVAVSFGWRRHPLRSATS